MRELRVEDALFYLDQVKVEFGDRPHIYNEFLDIMKTFKSQQIDTPGVIRRVSALFHGNKRLVLGFNTFLPEGYKIELPLDGGGPVAVYRAPGQTAVTQILGPALGGPAPPPSPPQQPPQPLQQQCTSVASSAPSQQQVMQQSQSQATPGPVPSSASVSRQMAARPPSQPMHHQQPHPQHAHAQQHQHQPVQASSVSQHSTQGPPLPHPTHSHAGHLPPAPLQQSQQQQTGKQPILQQQSPQSLQHQPQPAQAPAGMVIEQPPPGPVYQQHHLHVQQQQPHMQHGPVQPQMVPHQQQQPNQQPMISNDGRGRIPEKQGRVVPSAEQPQPQQQPQPQPQPQQPPAVRAQPPQQPPAMNIPPTGQPKPTPLDAKQPPPTTTPQPSSGTIPASSPQQPIEFDHAINYVTTIKKRFASEPETYKAFLEILHTYQKEQRGIKEVLDEVSSLFADHPDLLKEFTYFLPDAVQAQAKAQLTEVAKLAEARKRAAGAKMVPQQQQQQQVNRQRPPSQQQQQQPPVVLQSSQVVQGPNRVPAVGTTTQTFVPVVQPAPVPFGATQGRSEEREREICRSAIYGLISFAPVRPPRKNELTASEAASQHGRPRTIPLLPTQPTVFEAAFLERAKFHLHRKELAPDKLPGSRRHTPYAEFLKCLHLFGAGILNKDELALLLRSLFMQGHAPKSGVNAGGGASNPHVASAAQDLIKEFERYILVGRGPYADQEQLKKDKSKYGTLTTRDFDYSQSDCPTPSYRTLPPDFSKDQFLVYSGRTLDETRVLNEKIVCVGGSKRVLNSPEDYDGAKVRRNAYEDALFKVEDERFEVDMAIERNSSAMRQIEPLAEEATALKMGEERDGQPIGRMQYKLRQRSLNSIHIGAIARVYGDKGDEVVHHLLRNPIAVLPIVHRRLREKDAEWRRVRTNLIKHWRGVVEANYEGSFDTLCYFYKKEVERSFNTEQLLEECKRARHYVKHPRKQPNHEATRSIAPSFHANNPNLKSLLFQHHISVRMGNAMPHKDAYNLLTLLIMFGGVAKTNADREKVSRIWSEFVVPWFDLPIFWFARELRDRTRSDKSSCVVKYSPGQRVRTFYGDGQILSMLDNSHTSSSLRYEVEFPLGTGYIRPSAIVHALPSINLAQFARRGGFMEFVERPADRMEEEKKLEKGVKNVFGTEKMYLFMRLYCLLLGILEDAKTTLNETTPPKKQSIDHPASLQPPPLSNIIPTRTTNDETTTTTSSKTPQDFKGYNGFVSALHTLIKEEMNSKTFEAICRSLSKKKAHKFAALPRLLEKCAESMVKVAKEDCCLALFDLTQLKNIDLISLREQSFEITQDATYRIQYDETQMYFTYLPPEMDLLTSPKTTSSFSRMMTEGDLKKEQEEGSDGSGDEVVVPPTKRLKIKL